MKILSSLITAVLPGIVLTIFLALLPALLSLLNKKVQKMVSETDVEFGVVRKYFAFQVDCCNHPGCKVLALPHQCSGDCRRAYAVMRIACQIPCWGHCCLSA